MACFRKASIWLFLLFAIGQRADGALSVRHVQSLMGLQDAAGGSCNHCRICAAFALRSVYFEYYAKNPKPLVFFQANTFPDPNKIPPEFHAYFEKYPFYYVFITKDSPVDRDIAIVMDYAARVKDGQIHFDIGGVDVAKAAELLRLTTEYIASPRPGRPAWRALAKFELDLHQARGPLWTTWELSRMAYFDYLKLPNVFIYKNGKVLSDEEKADIVAAFPRP